ncbi:MAG: hypothetical protein PHQ66_01130 [Candidatus Nanoarchaeia archaeon]|nr:hypothetical protein [Candidatus Nanoarchaeia archaeon]MDD5588937.1 hypothetical protein [Candidatus Nanoarchaeia archaeon]
MNKEYENPDESEEISSHYLAERFICDNREENYSIEATEINREKHDRDLEKIAMEIMMEEYNDF